MTTLATTTGDTASSALLSATALDAATRLRAYVEAQADDLIDCCTWLGGPRWAYMADSFVMAVLRGGSFGRWPRSLLEALHRLLSLQMVDDAESAEAGRFVCLDLADARVERCCRHAEMLGGVLAALRTEERSARKGRSPVRVTAPAA